MPFTLITGPANAAKAGAVLERYRALLSRDPVLVVPTFADVDHYQRELAASGVVFAGEVATFAWVVSSLAGRLGVYGRPLGPVARERVVRAAIRDADLTLLAPSAATEGFVTAAGELFAELQREMVTPQRWIAALRSWGTEVGRERYAEELGSLYSAYRRRLERLRTHDAQGQTWAVLDALRADPAAWAERPVLFYGFDDLTRPQRDLIDTLVRRTAAEVVVALPYEPGREALAGSAPTVHDLEEIADRHERLPDRDEHYAPAARAALHHLERRLFEPDPPVASPDGAVRLLEAGGERAEAELVGAEVLALIDSGVEPADIAVAVRGRVTALYAEVLAGYGVPVAHERPLELDQTRLGAGVLALLRASLPGGTPADVMTWLRTPGKLRDAGVADWLDGRARRADCATVAELRRLDGIPEDLLRPLDDLRRAGPAEALERLVREADAIWTAPHRRAAAVLAGGESQDARAAAALRGAAAELLALAERDPGLLEAPGDVLDALSAVRVRPGGDVRGVFLADPLAIRARRFRAVFVCGLQDGEFPRRPIPEPFLDDDARRALSSASGLRLPLRETVMARERTVFYECASRAEEVLFLSFRSADEEGNAASASPFLADVRALFGDELWDSRGTRLLADVTWAPEEAPTAHELARALAASGAPEAPLPLAAPSSPAVLEALAARPSEPARGVEVFASCGVRWLVEHLLRPQAVEPDPEPMTRGSLVHAVLERVLRGLREKTGSARLTAARAEEAVAELDVALGELVGTPAGARARAALRAVRADLERYLRAECERGAAWQPVELEWEFRETPLRLADDVAVHGRVDRVDVGPGGEAIVRDYKGRVVHAGAKWAEEQRLQVALYALAARELLGLRPAAALYQPIGGGETRPRGVVREDVPGAYVATDLVDEGELVAVLGDARRTAVDAVRALHAGNITPCPGTCSPDGCAYPSICRSGAVPA